METTFERNYSLEIGDVILVSQGGYGLVWEDKGKYVEVIGMKKQKHVKRYRNKITGVQRRSRVNLLDKDKRASLLSNITG